MRGKKGYCNNLRLCGEAFIRRIDITPRASANNRNAVGRGCDSKVVLGIPNVHHIVFTAAYEIIAI